MRMPALAPLPEQTIAGAVVGGSERGISSAEVRSFGARIDSEVYYCSDIDTPTKLFPPGPVEPPPHDELALHMCPSITRGVRKAQAGPVPQTRVPFGATAMPSDSLTPLYSHQSPYSKYKDCLAPLSCTRPLPDVGGRHK